MRYITKRSNTFSRAKIYPNTNARENGLAIRRQFGPRVPHNRIARIKIHPPHLPAIYTDAYFSYTYNTHIQTHTQNSQATMGIPERGERALSREFSSHSLVGAAEGREARAEYRLPWEAGRRGRGAHFRSRFHADDTSQGASRANFSPSA